MKIVLISTCTHPSDQGLRNLSSFLKGKGHEVKMIFMTLDEDYRKVYSEKVLNELREICKDSELIGVSSYASTANRAIQIFNSLRDLNKILVWGGVHATISSEECIKHVDIVCVGEGEGAMLELIDSLEKKRDIKRINNFWIRENNKVYKNPVRNYISNLDSLPYADYDLEEHYILEKNKLVKFKEKHLGGQIFFLTGRGCPYNCSYCSNKLLSSIYSGKGKNVRWHSPKYIIDNIVYLKNKFKTIGVFDIRDDTFCIRPVEQVREFCEMYKEKVMVRFKCLADPKTTDDEKIRLLVDAGCTDIIVGIQGQERVNIEVYNRYQTDKQVLDAAKILNKYKDKLAVMYDVITTNPYEEKEDVINLIRLLMRIPKPYYLSVNNLVFFTGSELYKKAKKDGIIKSERDSAASLNYWDRWQHIKLKRKNAYLNLTLNLMRGVATEKRYGLMPSFLLRFLLRENIINFNLKNKILTYSVGNLVQVMDFFRENLAKGVYRSMPTSFKNWYDKVRYRV